jgi:hypothetical protein
MDTIDPWWILLGATACRTVPTADKTVGVTEFYDCFLRLPMGKLAKLLESFIQVVPDSHPSGRQIERPFIAAFSSQWRPSAWLLQVDTPYAARLHRA